jgi:hypothetical protein
MGLVTSCYDEEQTFEEQPKPKPQPKKVINNFKELIAKGTKHQWDRDSTARKPVDPAVDPAVESAVESVESAVESESKQVCYACQNKAHKSTYICPVCDTKY